MVSQAPDRRKRSDLGAKRTCSPISLSKQHLWKARRPPVAPNVRVRPAYMDTVGISLIGTPILVA